MDRPCNPVSISQIRTELTEEGSSEQRPQKLTTFLGVLMAQISKTDLATEVFFNSYSSNDSRFNEHGVITTPDSISAFAPESGKVKAEIHLAQVSGRWFAEYRFRFLCGRYQGSSLPISVFSEHFKTREIALRSAAERLIADVQCKCPDTTTLPAVQQKALEQLLKWAQSFLLDESQTAKPLAGKTFIDLFAGIGGFHQALSQLGAQCVGAAESDQHAASVYRANHGDDFPFFTDIRTLDPRLLPKFDILCAGFPCQSFSMAGNREGYAAKDKGALFFEIIRIASARKPSLLLLENVEGFANHDNGQTADVAIEALSQIGYVTSMEVLNAGDFGLPQQRKRLFIVAHRNDLVRESGQPFVFPKGEDNSRIVDDILEQGISSGRCSRVFTKTTGTKPADPLKPIGVGFLGAKAHQSSKVYSPKGKGATLCVRSGDLYLIGSKPRQLTPRECARMQGFPESFQLDTLGSRAKKQLGNAVAIPVVAAIASAANTHI